MKSTVNSFVAPKRQEIEQRTQQAPQNHETQAADAEEKKAFEDTIERKKKPGSKKKAKDKEKIGVEMANRFLDGKKTGKVDREGGSSHDEDLAHLSDLLEEANSRQLMDEMAKPLKKKETLEFQSSSFLDVKKSAPAMEIVAKAKTGAVLNLDKLVDQVARHFQVIKSGKHTEVVFKPVNTLLPQTEVRMNFTEKGLNVSFYATASTSLELIRKNQEELLSRLKKVGDKEISIDVVSGKAHADKPKQDYRGKGELV